MPIKFILSSQTVVQYYLKLTTNKNLLIGNLIMKLQQLRYALEIYRHNLNVSEAAEALFTSQPGISKQIKLLEEELGIQIFIRSGKRVVSVTPPGQAVLELAERILHNINNIKNIGTEFSGHHHGTLTIATSHTQACYGLPNIIQLFNQQYPKVKIHIRSERIEALTQLILEGEVDIAIATEPMTSHPDLKRIACSQWLHGIVVPHHHPLKQIAQTLTLSDLSTYPMVTYEYANNPRSAIYQSFQRSNITFPNVTVFCSDSNAIKNYVRQELGIGLIAQTAFNPIHDNDLYMIDVSHLFDPSPTDIILHADTYLRSYIYDFIILFAPHLNREKIDKALYSTLEEDYSI